MDLLEFSYSSKQRLRNTFKKCFVMGNNSTVTGIVFLDKAAKSQSEFHKFPLYIHVFIKLNYISC